MMGKPKPQDSFRTLVVEVLHRGKFFKNEGEGSDTFASTQTDRF